jgi:hypothetical protein
VAGCPNRDAAIALVYRVCTQLGSPVELRVVDIPDQQAAEQARFLGSPTIRVDGRDVEPGAEECVEYIHSCRLYRGQHSLRGLPDPHWVHQALRTAQAGRHELGVAALAAQAVALLEQVPAGEGIGGQAQLPAVGLFGNRGRAAGQASCRAGHRPHAAVCRRHRRLAPVRRRAGMPRRWQGLTMRDGTIIRIQDCPDGPALLRALVWARAS